MSRSKAVSSQNKGDTREDGRVQVIHASNSRLADFVTLMTQAEQEYWDVKREFDNLAHQIEEGSRLKSKGDLLATVPAEVNGDPAFLKTDPQTKELRDYGLDNTLSETFPCSDPLSSIPNPVSIPEDLENARRLRTPIFLEIYNLFTRDGGRRPYAPRTETNTAGQAMARGLH
jgi:hypothetical protein